MIERAVNVVLDASRMQVQLMYLRPVPDEGVQRSRRVLLCPVVALADGRARRPKVRHLASTNNVHILDDNMQRKLRSE